MEQARNCKTGWCLSEGQKRLVLCVAAGIAFMVICHGFLFLNPSYSHDSLSDLVRGHDRVQFSLGRFGQLIWRSVFGNVTATWFLGMVASVAIGISAFLIAEVLRIRRPWMLISLAGVLTTNYTMSNSVATYMSWVDIYGGALLFSVLAVWLAIRFRFGFLGGIPLIITVLSLYQPYALCVPALVLCRLLTWPEKEEKSWKDRGAFLLKMAVIFAISYGAYRLILHLILKKFDIAYSDGYNSITQVEISGLFSEEFLIRIGGAYQSFFHYLTAAFSCMPLSWLWAGLTVIVLVLEAVGMARFGGFKSVGNTIGFVLLLCLSPLVFNLQYLVSTKTYHVLMVYSIYFGYVLLLAMHERVLTKIDGLENIQENQAWRNPGMITKWVMIPVLFSVLIFSNIKYANSVYTEKYLRERATLSVMTRIMARAEQTKGYEPGNMSIAVVGELEKNPVVGKADLSMEKPEIGDPEGFVSVTYDMNSYLRYYLGYDKVKDTDRISELEAVRNMPVYPEDGFAKVMDGVLIVKISQ